jgi:DNA-binding response OmpR family regulator
MQDKPKVLIIDDDQVFSQHAAALLRAAGYASISVLDPVQGFMTAQRERPGLILLDVNLPAGGGLLLLERLTKTTQTQLIPIIVITARTDQETESLARAKGATGFVRKPIDRNTLFTAIEQALRPA